MNDPHPLDQVPGSGVLEQESRRARLDRLVDVLVHVERGQDEDPRGIVADPDAAGRLDAVHPRHSHVHHHDIGPRRRDDLEGLCAVTGLTDHLHVLLSAKNEPESGPDQLLIVHQDDADHAHGSRASTRNPPDARGPAVNVPPNMATRSRIPIRPCPFRFGGIGPQPSSDTSTSMALLE